MSEFALRRRSAPSTQSDYPVEAVQACGLGSWFAIVATAVATVPSSTGFGRFTTSYQGLDTKYTVLVVILVIVITWLRWRFEPVIPVTVVLATTGCVAHAARRGGDSHQLAGLVH